MLGRFDHHGHTADPQERDVTPTQYLRVFARFWWLVCLCVVAGIAVSWVLNAWSSPTYISSASVLVSGAPTADTTSADAYSSTLLAQQRMAVYEGLVNGPALDKEVLDSADLKLSPQELEDRIEIVVPDNSTVLNITVRDSDRDRAQQIASTAATSAVNIINGVENAQGPEKALLRARVTARAPPPPRLLGATQCSALPAVWWPALASRWSPLGSTDDCATRPP
jgi:capsular polysaccharide biosynthesis protein